MFSVGFYKDNNTNPTGNTLENDFIQYKDDFKNDLE